MQTNLLLIIKLAISSREKYVSKAEVEMARDFLYIFGDVEPLAKI